jgi:hypothetical protein
VTSEGELRILQILSKKLLARSREIKAEFGRSDGVDVMLSTLLSVECVNVIEPMGEKCFLITHKGAKVLEDAKAAGWKAAPQASQSLSQ